MTYIPGGGAGGGADGFTVLWEWNGLDVTQFGDGLGGPSVTQVGVPTGVLSRSTIGTQMGGTPIDMDPATPILSYQFAGSPGGFATSIYLINDLPTLPERYVIEGRIGPRQGATTLGASCAPELLLAYQAVDRRAVLYAAASGSITHRIVFANGAGEDATNNGSFNDMISGGLPFGETGLPFRIGCDFDEPAVASNPGMRFECSFRGAPGEIAVVNDTIWSVFGTGVTPGGGGWNAAWQVATSVKQPGIAFAEAAAGAGEGYFSDLRILSWPGVD